MLFPESFFSSFGNVGMIEHPLVRRLRGVVFFDDLGTVSVFFLKFQAGTEVILQWAPECTVNLVHQRNELGVVQPFIAE